MLWNKNTNGTAELREYNGFLYAQTNFEHIKGDLQSEERKMRKLVGEEIWSLAQNHYDSANFGTGGQYQVLDDLINYLRSPMAIFAYLTYAPTNDMMHGTDGRLVKFSEDQRPAQEWQIERSENSLRKRAYQDMDLLLEYLDTQSGIENNPLVPWRSTESFKSLAGLFVATTADFNYHFPIDNSRWIFQQLLPFIREVERQYIKPAITAEKFEDLKKKLRGEASFGEGEHDFIQDYLRPIVVAAAMAQGLRKLSVQLLPEGIIQGHTGDRLTIKNKAVANVNERIALAMALEEDRDRLLMRLAEYQEQQAATADETYVKYQIEPTQTEESKFFRT